MDPILKGSNSEMVAMIGKEFDVQSSFGNKVTLKGPDSQQNWTFYHEDLKLVSDSENIVSTAMPERS